MPGPATQIALKIEQPKPVSNSRRVIMAPLNYHGPKNKDRTAPDRDPQRTPFETVPLHRAVSRPTRTHGQTGSSEV
jgi:hypothetical protein